MGTLNVHFIRVLSSRCKKEVEHLYTIEIIFVLEKGEGAFVQGNILVAKRSRTFVNGRERISYRIPTCEFLVPKT